MATAEQLKSLIRSHLGGDAERFYTIALQVAAHEAQTGHGELAQDIRTILDKSRETANILKTIRVPQDLQGLVIIEEPSTTKESLVLPALLKARLDRIIHEYRQQFKLKNFGLENRRKILLVGSPGTGKTMTARVLAHELKLKLNTVQVDKLVTKFMGETSAKLRQIFDIIRENPGVYLFDEFDAIGGERSLSNDVGEMRRVLNAFLQFIERDTSSSLIIATTNSPVLLDRALYRRFDDVLNYEYPEGKDRYAIVRNLLGTFWNKGITLKLVSNASTNLSHAEIDRACRDAIKQAILADQKTVSPILLCHTLKDRRDAHQWKRK